MPFAVVFVVKKQIIIIILSEFLTHAIVNFDSDVIPAKMHHQRLARTRRDEVKQPAARAMTSRASRTLTSQAVHATTRASLSLASQAVRPSLSASHLNPRHTRVSSVQRQRRQQQQHILPSGEYRPRISYSMGHVTDNHAKVGARKSEEMRNVHYPYSAHSRSVNHCFWNEPGEPVAQAYTQWPTTYTSLDMRTSEGSHVARSAVACQRCEHVYAHASMTESDAKNNMFPHTHACRTTQTTWPCAGMSVATSHSTPRHHVITNPYQHSYVTMHESQLPGERNEAAYLVTSPVFCAFVNDAFSTDYRPSVRTVAGQGSTRDHHRHYSDSGKRCVTTQTSQNHSQNAYTASASYCEAPNDRIVIRLPSYDTEGARVVASGTVFHSSCLYPSPSQPHSNVNTSDVTSVPRKSVCTNDVENDKHQRMDGDRRTSDTSSPSAADRAQDFQKIKREILSVLNREDASSDNGVKDKSLKSSTLCAPQAGPSAAGLAALTMEESEIPEKDTSQSSHASAVASARYQLHLLADSVADSGKEDASNTRSCRQRHRRKSQMKADLLLQGSIPVNLRRATVSTCNTATGQKNDTAANANVTSRRNTVQMAYHENEEMSNKNKLESFQEMQEMARNLMDERRNRVDENRSQVDVSRTEVDENRSQVMEEKKSQVNERRNQMDERQSQINSASSHHSEQAAHHQRSSASPASARNTDAELCTRDNRDWTTDRKLSQVNRGSVASPAYPQSAVNREWQVKNSICNSVKLEATVNAVGGQQSSINSPPHTHNRTNIHSDTNTSPRRTNISISINPPHTNIQEQKPASSSSSDTVHKVEPTRLENHTMVYDMPPGALLRRPTVPEVARTEPMDEEAGLEDNNISTEVMTTPNESPNVSELTPIQDLRQVAEKNKEKPLTVGAGGKPKTRPSHSSRLDDELEDLEELLEDIETGTKGGDGVAQDIASDKFDFQSQILRP